MAPTTIKGLRFVPNSFQYNGRVAAALLPSLVVLTGFGGKPAVGALMVGVMVTYILDALRYKEGAFGAVWLTMGAVNLSIILTGAPFAYGRPVILGILVIFVNGSVLLLTGVWATLQFKWIQVQYPMVALALEKVLICTCLPVATMVQSWGVVAAVGASHGAYYVAAILCAMYYLFARPLPSSFYKSTVERSMGGRNGSSDSMIQDKIDGLMSSLLLVFVPPVFYVAVHVVVLFSWVHYFSLLLLASGPCLFLTSLPDGLWWLPGRRQAGALRKLLLLLSLGSFLAGLEGRVIFHSFGQYIKLHPPLNYIAVTVALYGAAVLVLLHLSGLLGDEVGSSLEGTALMLSAGAGSIAAGVPIMVMPAPLVAAGGLAMYLESGTLRDYSLFVLGAMVTGCWFVVHHFWFLDIWMAAFSLQTVCKCILAAMLPALLLPGFIRSGASRNAISVLLLVQAVLVFVLEEHLYAGDHAESSAEMYPAFLVVLTSLLGMAVTQRMRGNGRIGGIATWGLQCLYTSKLAMLLVPEAKLAVPVLGIALAVTPPVLLYESGAKRPRLRPWQAAVHVVSIVLAVILARFAVFDILQWLSAARPSEGLLAGVLLITVAAGCAPLVSVFYSTSTSARRALAMVAAAGMLLLLLRPPMPIKGGSKCPDLPFGLCPRVWDESHVPEHEVDDINIYGTGMARREHWPLWMLVGAVLSGLAAATSAVPITRSVAARLAYAALSGVFVGAYIALDFFPGQIALQGLLLGATLLVAAFLVLLQLPTAASPLWLPWLAAAWGLAFPVALLLQADLELPPLPEDAVRLYPDASRQIEEERFENNRAALLAVYAAQALLLAFALKLKVGAALKGHKGPAMPVAAVGYMGGGSAQRAADFLGACLPRPHALAPIHRIAHLKGAAGAAMTRLAAEGLTWVPTAGNLITFLCFGLCLSLNAQITGGSDGAIFVLAPALLLLNQDPLLLWGLGDKQRYFLPMAAVSIYLIASAASQLVQQAFVEPESLATSHMRELWYLLKNALCLVLTWPDQAAFLRYLWDRQRVSGTLLLVMAPLNLAALIFTDLRTVQILAGLGIAMALTQHLFMRHVRRVGQKLI